jgi:hypothetical protein
LIKTLNRDSQVAAPILCTVYSVAPLPIVFSDVASPEGAKSPSTHRAHKAIRYETIPEPEEIEPEEVEKFK